MRALLINPADKSVTEVVHNGDYRQIYELIDCQTFACPVIFPNEDTLYCDDEGLFNPDIIGGIMMVGWSSPIVGKCLILGADIETGESVDAVSTVEEITGQITKWLSAEDARDYAMRVMETPFNIVTF